MQSGSPAADAGIEAGDTIVGIGNTAVGSASELKSALINAHPGDKVSSPGSTHSGAQQKATVTLIEGPPA